LRQETLAKELTLFLEAHAKVAPDAGKVEDACYRFRCMMSQIRSAKKAGAKIPKAFAFGLGPVFDLCSVDAPSQEVAAACSDPLEVVPAESSPALEIVPTSSASVVEVVAVSSEEELTIDELLLAIEDTPQKPSEKPMIVTPEKPEKPMLTPIVPLIPPLDLDSIDALIGKEGLETATAPTAGEYKAKFLKRPPAAKSCVARLNRPGAPLKRPAAASAPLDPVMRKRMYSKAYHDERLRLVRLGMGMDDAKLAAQAVARECVRLAEMGS